MKPAQTASEIALNDLSPLARARAATAEFLAHGDVFAPEVLASGAVVQKIATIAVKQLRRSIRPLLSGAAAEKELATFLPDLGALIDQIFTVAVGVEAIELRGTPAATPEREAVLVAHLLAKGMELQARKYGPWPALEVESREAAATRMVAQIRAAVGELVDLAEETPAPAVEAAQEALEVAIRRVQTGGAEGENGGWYAERVVFQILSLLLHLLRPR